MNLAEKLHRGKANLAVNLPHTSQKEGFCQVVTAEIRCHHSANRRWLALGLAFGQAIAEPVVVQPHRTSTQAQSESPLRNGLGPAPGKGFGGKKRWVMLKPVTILIVSLNLLFVGCNKQSIPTGGPARKNAASTASATTPQSTQGSKTSSSTNKLPLELPIVIDVTSNAEIGGVVRSIFQDSKGVLWVGGEGDLFRNDGKTVTSYDIKDDLGNGVTIKQIIFGVSPIIITHTV